MSAQTPTQIALRRLFSHVAKISVAFCVAVLLTTSVHAQISGGYTYDESNRAFFITGDTSVYGNITRNFVTHQSFSDSFGNDVFVGKDNYTSFTTFTPTPPIILTVNGADDGSTGAEISGTYSANIGLNLFGGNKVNMSGGRLYYRYRAYDASMTNFSGGVINSVQSFNNASINVSGGHISNAEGFNASTTNISGGDVHYGYTGYDTSTINISGGNLGGVFAHDATITNISGGTISKPDAYNPGGYQGFDASILNMTGGSLSGASCGKASTITISGGTVVGGVSGGKVSVSGGVVGGAGGGVDSIVNISGGIVGEAFVNGANAILNISGGAVNRASPGPDGGTVNISNGVVNSVIVYLNSQVNISGGYVSEAFVNPASPLNISGGVVNQVFGSANIRGGTVDSLSLLYATDGSANFYGAGLTAVAQNGYGYYDGEVRIVREYQLGGTLTSGDALTTYITAGDYTGDSSHLSFTAPAVAGNLYLTENAAINSPYNEVTIGQSQDGAVQTSPSVSVDTGAFLRDVSAYNASNVAVNDGVINGSLSAYNTSAINVYGGTITEILAYDSSVFNLYGGVISADTIYQQSDTAIFDFFGKVVPVFSSAMAGTDNNGNSGVFYDVAWTQSNGATVNTRYFDLNGDENNASPQGILFNGQGLTAAPEPGTLALTLLILPAVGLILRRRR